MQYTNGQNYDQMGHLITETTETGDLIKDYVWSDQMMPVAQIDNSGGTETITYLYTDHLMTNRLATSQSKTIIWRWEGEAFGNTQAQELAGVSVSLRFPGQYYDSETNLHYNWNRYYDPALGRYITSNPIGLQGGMNTYNYVGSNPVNFIDVRGLYSRTEKYNEYWEVHITCPDEPGYTITSSAVLEEGNPKIDCRKYVQTVIELRNCNRRKPAVDCKATCHYEKMECPGDSFETEGTCEFRPLGYPYGEPF